MHNNSPSLIRKRKICNDQDNIPEPVFLATANHHHAFYKCLPSQRLDKNSPHILRLLKYPRESPNYKLHERYPVYQSSPESHPPMQDVLHHNYSLKN